MSVASVFWKYWLLQVPGWLLLSLFLYGAHHWIDLPLTWAAAVFAVWLVKDVALYPILGKAYARRELPESGLVGEEATAEQALGPSGYVNLRGELWRAELAPSPSSSSASGGAESKAEPSVAAGGRVRVVAVEGLTLRVVPKTD